MSEFLASTPQSTANISVIPDISENFKPETYNSNTSYPPEKSPRN